MPIIALMLLLLAGCASETERSEADNAAYVGPHSLDLLAELRADAEVAATLTHGDRVEIVGGRRRFARVRTASGLEGWTDGWMLLSGEQMARARRLARRAAQLPSQGRAGVYEVLNVHTSPHRQAPSFYQIKEEVEVDVVARRVVPRAAYTPPTVDHQVFPRLSYGPSPEVGAPPGSADDWSLVRLPDGRAGWALSRMLVMGIPDEVAQYAQGDRITSYFSLGEVLDGDQRRHHWLWTTLSSGLKPYEFDSFRVFVWSLRRHRYETAYVERNLVGHYPVDVQSAPDPAAPGAEMLQFSLVVRDEGDEMSRRTYVFRGYRVRLVAEEPWRPPREELLPPPESPPVERAQEGLAAGIVRRIKGWLQ